MSERGGESSGEASEQTTTNPRTRAIATWSQAVITILAVSSVLATKLLPQATGKTVSSVLPDAMVIVFIVALPFLEVLLWRLRRELPAQGRWGLVLILVGLGIGSPIGVAMVFAATFLPALSPPDSINVALLVVLCAVFASVFLGLLLVFVNGIRGIVQLFRDGRRATGAHGRRTANERMRRHARERR